MSFSAFLAFPGQGSQHLSMLSDGGILDIALSKEFSHAIECCSDLISHDAFKLIEEGPEELINQTSITQPLLVLCSYLHFNKQLKSNKVKKIYEAILVGVLDKDIKIKSKIDTSTKQHSHKVTESIDGKKAVSMFKILKKFKSFTHVEVHISTGRMHQIRVQSSNLNHPIVNDIKYGLFDLNKYIYSKTSIGRLALHAKSISFKDLNNQVVCYEAPKNNEFDKLMTELSDLTVKS